MELLLLSFLAGILTVISPCVLPILPVVLAGSAADKNKRAPFVIIASLAASVFFFTLLLKGTSVLLGVSSDVWLFISGIIVLLVGLSMLLPRQWEKVSLKLGLGNLSNKLSGSSKNRRGNLKYILLGLSLGPIFTSCSPTYGLILATVLPANFVQGTVYIAMYILGLSAVLLLIALGGQRFTKRMGWLADPHGSFRRVLAVILVVIGLFITTGWIKSIETWFIERGFLGLSSLEQRFINEADTGGSTTNDQVVVPAYLKAAFPKTDWSRADESITKALSGGPGKDGIPAIDNPAFVPLSEFKQPDSVQAIVIADGDSHKVYPYNILVWHEIVNDTVNGVPVAVTFCPLCGSAIMYNRTLPDGVSTFGVSGSLIESNMVMYDRRSESLWQQSTGKALAGKYFGTQLELVSFQLLTIGEVRAKYPNATVLSDNTGYSRDYERNPYAGYEESEDFIFSPSKTDERYPSKTIFVAFNVANSPVAVPWLTLKDGKTYSTTIADQAVSLQKSDGELRITDINNQEIPFYFEMWFSWAVQHQEDGTVYDPNKEN